MDSNLPFQNEMFGCGLERARGVIKTSLAKPTPSTGKARLSVATGMVPVSSNWGPVWGDRDPLTIPQNLLRIYLSVLQDLRTYLCPPDPGYGARCRRGMIRSHGAVLQPRWWLWGGGGDYRSHQPSVCASKPLGETFLRWRRSPRVPHAAKHLTSDATSSADAERSLSPRARYPPARVGGLHTPWTHTHIHTHTCTHTQLRAHLACASCHTHRVCLACPGARFSFSICLSFSILR